MTPHSSSTVPYWQQPALPIPVLRDEVRADTCVIGLGGSGLAAVHALIEAGQTVVGLDAAAVAGGAAGRNGGFLLAGAALFHHEAVRRYGHGWAIALYRLTQQQLQRIAQETPDCVSIGFSIRRAADEEEVEDCRAELAAFEADHIDADWYEGPEGVGLAVYGDGVFHPQRRTTVLARRALDRGARLYVHSPAIEVRGDEVRTPMGSVRCRSVIVAVDGGLHRVLPELEPRVRNVRLQMLATEPDPNLRFAGPVYSRYGHDYWQQRPDGQILLGGGRDRAGRAELSDDATVTEFVQDYLTEVLRRDVGSHAAVTHRWAGIVSYSDDDLPILEEVRPGVMAVGAYSGTGNVLGAAAARDAAAWVCGGHTPLADLLQGARRDNGSRLRVRFKEFEDANA